MTDENNRHVDTLYRYIEIALKGWYFTPEAREQERNVRRSLASHMTSVHDQTRQRVEALCSTKRIDPSHAMWAGMGGASGPDVTPGTQVDPDPEFERTVYDETLKVPVEASTSKGVGRPLYDPDAAGRQIEDDPASVHEWWPQKSPDIPTSPPPLPSHESLLNRLLSWFSR